MLRFKNAEIQRKKNQKQTFMNCFRHIEGGFKTVYVLI